MTRQLRVPIHPAITRLSSGGSRRVVETISSACPPPPAPPREHTAPPGECTDEHCPAPIIAAAPARPRSEEHTSELQSLMRISYAVFCLKKKKKKTKQATY